MGTPRTSNGTVNDAPRPDASPPPSARTAGADSGDLLTPSQSDTAGDVVQGEVIQAATDVGSLVHGSPLRWWLGVAVALGLSLPLGWLLSMAATLPFYLGLFFFALFGLMMGAAVFRVAALHRPYRRFTVLAGTILIILFAWSVSMVLEARGFAPDMANEAIRRSRDLGDRSHAEYLDAVQRQISAHLRKNYPPGGTIGYMRWAATSGVLHASDLAAVKVRLPPQPQRRIWWVIRVVLSLGLLAFGVGSQTLPLSATGTARGDSMNRREFNRQPT